jgi:hypothetical protein
MKATVISEFEDVVAGVRRRKGDVIDIDADRVAVLRKANVIGAVMPDAPAIETATLESPEQAVTVKRKKAR